MGSDHFHWGTIVLDIAMTADTKLRELKKDERRIYDILHELDDIIWERIDYYKKEFGEESENKINQFYGEIESALDNLILRDWVAELAEEQLDPEIKKEMKAKEFKQWKERRKGV